MLWFMSYCMPTITAEPRILTGAIATIMLAARYILLIRYPVIPPPIAAHVYQSRPVDFTLADHVMADQAAYHL